MQCNHQSWARLGPAATRTGRSCLSRSVVTARKRNGTSAAGQSDAFLRAVDGTLCSAGQVSCKGSTLWREALQHIWLLQFFQALRTDAVFNSHRHCHSHKRRSH